MKASDVFQPGLPSVHLGGRNGGGSRFASGDAIGRGVATQFCRSTVLAPSTVPVTLPTSGRVRGRASPLRTGRAPAPSPPPSGAAPGRSDSAAARTREAGEKEVSPAPGPASPAAARRDTAPTPSGRDRPHDRGDALAGARVQALEELDQRRGVRFRSQIGNAVDPLQSAKASAVAPPACSGWLPPSR